jgi:endonuclease-3
VKLTKRLERKNWIVVNNLLVRHGQDTCKPVQPRCETCILADTCETGQKTNRDSK